MQTMSYILLYIQVASCLLTLVGTTACCMNQMAACALHIILHAHPALLMLLKSIPYLIDCSWDERIPAIRSSL